MSLFRRNNGAREIELTEAQRARNVGFASSLLEVEIAQRNARKDAQENTARGLIVTAGVVLTLLLGLANDVGLFSSRTSIVARIALVVTVCLGAGVAAASMAVLWPRRYARIGEKALDTFNQEEFLDEPTHQVTGTVVATRISIAKTMDRRHEQKARWLKWAFRLLAGAFIALVFQAVVLVVDPPPPKPSATVRILSGGGLRLELQR
jgi:hypothetical protein